MFATSPHLSDEHRTVLLAIARQAIAYGLDHGKEIPVDHKQYAEVLQEARATFVTLDLDERLRGCIGTLESKRPLVTDVAHNGYAAAFQDPRFKPVIAKELDQLHIHIALLSPLEGLQFDSEEELEKQLRPGVDGLLIEEGPCRGTFLPAVWETIPQPRQFLLALKRKAGLLDAYWSKSVRAWRYTTESFQ